jgi:hypothetical protein
MVGLRAKFSHQEFVMSQQLRNGLYVVAGVVLCLVLVYGLGTAKARPEAADVSGKYTVVATDGTHLIVTDNSANKVYFYAIDQGGKPGDELKYRGELNLADVGKPVLKPTKAK